MTGTTKLTTNEQRDLSIYTGGSTFEIINNKTAIAQGQTSTLEAKVLVFNFPEPGTEATPDDFVDIDDYIDEISQDENDRTALLDARKEIASDLYGERISIASLRLQHGWSQRDLARIIGTKQPHISRLEAGTIDPHLSTLKKLADAFEISLGQLSEALAKQAEDTHG